ncbi:hypothetical protein ACWEGE_23810 [Amycolatopsis sp. NPDC004747]
MNGFAVDTARLVAVSRRLDNQVSDDRTRTVLRYSIQPELVWDEDLAVALTRFQEASRSAVRAVMDDAETLVERLSTAADVYERFEEGPLRDLLKHLAGSGGVTAADQ